MKKILSRNKSTTSDGNKKIVTTIQSPFSDKVIVKEKKIRNATTTSPKSVMKTKDVRVDGKLVSFKDKLKVKGYKKVETGTKKATGGYDFKTKTRGKRP
jgi:hypothetical protein